MRNGKNQTMILKEVCNQIHKHGGTPYLVGGYVRDVILGLSNKDVDIEVFGLDADSLIAAISKLGRVDTVGRSFGVIKLTTASGEEFDLSLPRRESKSGQGHKGFIVEPDPTMTLKEAASRRDFTINAIYQNAITDEIVDHFDGINDLKQGVIRHTSSAFVEDPLRVLRGMQFAARFGFVIAPDTAQLCAQLIDEYAYLSTDRIWGEWWKWATKSTVPSKGLEFLRRSTWLTKYPMLNNLVDCPQDPIWHPEGDVWVHTMHVVDAAATIAIRDQLATEDRGVLLLAALCHDIGKPPTTVFERDRWRSPRHDRVGAEMTVDFLTSIGTPHRLIDRVSEMVREHMVHVYVSSITKRYARRFLARLDYSSIDDMMRVIEADCSGRPPLPGGLPELAHRLALVCEEVANEVKPYVLGRHLIEMGMQPGPHFGAILKRIFDAQLDGEFHDVDSGIAWAKTHELDSKISG